MTMNSMERKKRYPIFPSSRLSLFPAEILLCVCWTVIRVRLELLLLLLLNAGTMNPLSSLNTPNQPFTSTKMEIRLQCFLL